MTDEQFKELMDMLEKIRLETSRVDSNVEYTDSSIQRLEGILNQILNHLKKDDSPSQDYPPQPAGTFT